MLTSQICFAPRIRPLVRRDDRACVLRRGFTTGDIAASRLYKNAFPFCVNTNVPAGTQHLHSINCPQALFDEPSGWSMKAIVTGAAGGIGRACALRLSAACQAQGRVSNLLLVDLDERGMDASIAEIESRNGKAQALSCDLSDRDSGDRIASAAERVLGGLDLVVNSAGIVRRGSLAATPLDDYENVMAVNTRAIWLLAKASYPLLKATHGCFIAIASVSGSHQTANLGSYSASKAALIMLIRQLAFEWAPFGVRCNTVSPGSIETPMNAAVHADPEEKRRRSRMIPLRRQGRAEEVAAAVAFLASSDASYVTGIDLLVDGGLSTRLLSPVDTARSGQDYP